MPRQSKDKQSSPQLPRIVLYIFILMAVLSFIGLDYMNWTLGKKSYIFGSKKEVAVARPAKALGDAVQEQMAVLNISADGIRQFWDNDQSQHLMIDLDEEEYTRLLFPLEQTFSRIEATVLKKEEYLDDQKKYYLWQVQGEKNERLSLLFSCPVLSTAEKAPAKPRKGIKAAIIMDDMGYNLRAINSVTQIDLPITVAVLPYTPMARETAEIAHENGLEVLLHLPLESMNEEEGNRMEGIILSGMSEEKINEVITEDLKEIPHVSGVNSHMGSKVTQDWTLMRIILEKIKKERLFFVDSLTIGDSVAFKMAKSLDVPSARRHVFLDGTLTEAYILGQLRTLFRTAQTNGYAIGICHPSEMTLKVLNENLKKLQQQYDVELVFASQVVD